MEGGVHVTDECWSAYVPLGPISSDKTLARHTFSPSNQTETVLLFHTDIRRLPGLRTGGKTLCRTVVTWESFPKAQATRPIMWNDSTRDEWLLFFDSHQRPARDLNRRSISFLKLRLGTPLPEALVVSQWCVDTFGNSFNYALDFSIPGMDTKCI